MGIHQHDTQAGDEVSTAARGNGVTPEAVAELLAWSDALDRAEAWGLARGRAEAAAGRQLTAHAVDRARVEGYAEAIADVKAAQHAIADAVGAEAKAERSRWIVRGEVRTRATFGAPHPDDYRGGPIALPAPEQCDSGQAGVFGCAA